MINCGAICDVVDLLSHLSPEAYTYIIDSNRPVHLANVYPKRDRCPPPFLMHTYFVPGRYYDLTLTYVRTGRLQSFGHEDVRVNTINKNIRMYHTYVRC